MKPFTPLTLGILFFLLCSSAWSGELVIDGTGDSQLVLRTLANIFEQRNPGDRVIIPDSVGSGGGVKSLIRGEAGLARTARPLNKKEGGHGFVEVPFAVSPVVFAANPEGISQVKTLSISQILGMYGGEITNWSQLGGPDHKLFLIDRETGDSSKKVIDDYLASALGKDRQIGFGGKTFFTTPEAAEAIAVNRYSIGYLPYSIARSKGLHLFGIDGVLPDAESIKTRQYPFVATLYLVRPKDPGALAKKFLIFITTDDDARESMIAHGLFPVD